MQNDTFRSALRVSDPTPLNVQPSATSTFMTALLLYFSIKYLLIVVFISIAFLVVARRTTRKEEKSLPGPTGIPWVGPIWDLQHGTIQQVFKMWADRYGPILIAELFGKKMIIVSSTAVATEILGRNGTAASDRPPIALVEGSRDNGKYLPFMGYHDLFTRSRKYGSTLIRYTHQAQYHARLLPEILTMLSTLQHKNENPFDLLETLCSRFSAGLAYGSPENHTAITMAAHHLMCNLSPRGHITNIIHELQLLPTWLNPSKADEAQRVEVEDRIWTGNWERARALHQTGQLPLCYARYYFDDPEKSQLSDDEALHSIGMLGTVSTLTIMAPVQRWLIAMTLHPEWQKKVQQELDEQIGNRIAEFRDSAKLPVLRASMVEALRWSSPLPTGIPHRMMEDRQWNGYNIAKGTGVIVCDWTISRSEDLYPDSDSFNPGRYLDPDSVMYKTPLTEHPRIQGHHVFGWGRRSCMGQDYVAAEMLSICAAYLFAFDITIKRDGTGQIISQPNVDNATPFVIPIVDHDESSKLEFKPRSEARARLIDRMHKEKPI